MLIQHKSFAVIVPYKPVKSPGIHWVSDVSQGELKEKLATDGLIFIITALSKNRKDLFFVTTVYHHCII